MVQNEITVESQTWTCTIVVEYYVETDAPGSEL